MNKIRRQGKYAYNYINWTPQSQVHHHSVTFAKCTNSYSLKGPRRSGLWFKVPTQQKILLDGYYGIITANHKCEQVWTSQVRYLFYNYIVNVTVGSRRHCTFHNTRVHKRSQCHVYDHVEFITSSILSQVCTFFNSKTFLIEQSSEFFLLMERSTIE